MILRPEIGCIKNSRHRLSKSSALDLSFCAVNIQYDIQSSSKTMVLQWGQKAKMFISNKRSDHDGNVTMRCKVHKIAIT